MTRPLICRLAQRGAVRVAGPGAGRLLQGVLAQDLSWGGSKAFALSEEPAGRAQAAALLNARGRVLADLIVHERTAPLREEAQSGESRDVQSSNMNNDFVLECDVRAAPEIASRLRSLRLHAGEEERSQMGDAGPSDATGVKVADVSHRVAVWAQWVPSTLGETSGSSSSVPGHSGVPLPRHLGGVWRTDPRHRSLGWRCLVPRGTLNDSQVAAEHQNAASVVSPEQYEVLRTELGVAEGPDEIVPEKALPFEANLDFYNALSLSKGCYIGQELTARTKHTGVTRKRLIPFRCGHNGVLPGMTLQSARGGRRAAGHVVAFRATSGIGFALMRLEAVAKRVEDSAVSLTEGGGEIALIEPSWWQDVMQDMQGET